MAASGQYLDSDGATALFVENWINAFAGANNQPRKFGFINNGTRVLGNSPGPAAGFQVAVQQVGQNDGSTQVRIIADLSTLSRPFGLAAALGGGGGAWGATGTYGWKVTALNAVGETVGSFEATFNVTDMTKQVALTWTTISGATSYKVYRTPTPGTYGASTLIATLGATGSYNDTGSAGSAGAPPAQNTSGDWKQSTPAASGGGAFAAGTYFWTVAAYDSTGVLLAISRESTLAVTLNQQVALAWPAVFGAATYSVFRTTTGGSYPAPSTVATGVTGTTFTDTGAAATGAGLTNPLSITLLQSFGFAPAGLAAQTQPITVYSGNLGIGQEFFFWVNRVVPGATPESGNTRAANLIAQEF